MSTPKQEWDIEITPASGWLKLNLNELWKYRDLISLMVRRDLVLAYKQTILGPLWMLLQPLIASVIFTIVFGKVARIPTDEIPPLLFYLSGTITWGFFSNCLTGTSNTFVANAGVFGKVYFPRLTVPISVIIAGAGKFLISFMIFIVIYLYQIKFVNNHHLIDALWALPLATLQIAILSLGVGLLVSSAVIKYRDISFLMGFATQLWMYASPVIYPISQIPEKYQNFYAMNPMAMPIELFRFSFFGTGVVRTDLILFSWAITLLLAISGLIFFNRVEKSFVDTV